MDTDVRAALTGDQWVERRGAWGRLELERRGGEVLLSLRYGDGEAVSVSSADTLTQLIALANEALPKDDPRKITREDEHVLNALAASIEVEAGNAARLLPMLDALCEKIAAMLLHR